MKFTDLDLEDEVLDGLDAMRFDEATPIQEACIPPLLEGRDVLGCAQTGSGKTAAYLLPIINRICSGELPSSKVNAVVMAPTRELAQQIDRQVEGFSYFVSLSTLAIYGGTDGIGWEQQRRGMEMGADIVIATPGRLLSMLNLQACDLSGVSYFVLDEADRMLDMGFYNDIMSICKDLPSTCQMVMFSATMPPKIKTLARTILKNPVHVELAISRPPESILQTAYICYPEQKLPIIRSLMNSSFIQEGDKRSIIFSSSKLEVRNIYSALKQSGVSVATIHSDLEQTEREAVLKNFRSGAVRILVATDVVSRGIDIDNIGLVINYELPHDHEDYVHRIGRTARGTDGEGIAITLIAPADQQGFVALQRFLGKEIRLLPVDSELGPVPEFNPDQPAGGGYRGRRNGGNKSTDSRTRRKKTPASPRTHKSSERKKQEGNSLSQRKSAGQTTSSTTKQRRGKRPPKGRSEKTTVPEA